MDILAPRKKKWCGHFSADIIGQFSAVYLYDYVRIILSAIFRFLNFYLYNYKQVLGFESFATKRVPSEIYV
jgi:hypothetical protein